MGRGCRSGAPEAVLDWGGGGGGGKDLRGLTIFFSVRGLSVA